MRKLLLASAALLGVTGGLAFAQTPANPSQGQLAAPYGAGPASNNNNNAWGVANTPSGSKDAGPLSTVYAPNVVKVPAPGTIVIRLNGRVEVDVGAAFTSVDKGVNANGTPNGFKVNPVAIGSYMRLYPGFDGLAANGLRYGASVELRENFTSATSTTGTVNGPSANTSGETVYVRRAFTYLASDNVGIVRLGQSDGVLGLFDNCIFTSQCWDAGLSNISGGANQNIAPQAAANIPFVWLNGSGADYGNSKIVYLSPQFYGLDFGAQYAPNEGNSFQNGSGGCNQASASCISVTSGNDASRWYNQVGLGVRYQQTFGAVDTKAYGFYETAGKENNTINAVTAAPGTAAYRAAGAGQLRYDNLSFYKAGVAVTALNFTLATDYIGGAVNGQLGMRPTGGVNMNAVLTGLTYSNGPITLSSQFGFINSQGAAQLTGTSQRREYVMALGGNYKLAPGLQLVAEYQYWQRHQGNFDFANPTVIGTTRDARGQSAVLATVLTW